MKYKKPKYSSYKKFNKNPSRVRSSKRWLWIGIAIAVAVLLIAGGIIFAVVRANQNQQEGQQNVQHGQIGNPNAEEIKSLQIGRAPNKTLYYCGESFDATGLKVYAYMTGGGFVQVELNECTIAGFDSSVAVETQTITVTYKGFTDTFDVVIKAPLSATPVLQSIVMETLPKTEYKLGEDLDITDGTFIATYSDGTTKTIKLSNKYIYGFREAYEAGVGEYDITVKYTKNGVTAETTYKITITQ